MAPSNGHQSRRMVDPDSDRHFGWAIALGLYKAHSPSPKVSHARVQRSAVFDLGTVADLNKEVDVVVVQHQQVFVIG